MTNDRPHVVLIVADTARADAFQPYGSGTSTPTVADLAAQGQAHPYAVASSSWTLPSHVGLLLGLDHQVAGLIKARQQDRGAAREVLVANHDRYLPAVLRRNGYRTMGGSANPWIASRTGFDQGFDEFNEIWTTHGIPPKRLPAKATPIWAGWLATRGRIDSGLEKAGRLAQSWIASASISQQPHFLFLNLMECHAPWWPSRDCALGPAARARGGYVTARLDMVRIWRANLSGTLPCERSLEILRLLYSCAARRIDDWLGWLLTELDRNHLLERTRLIVTSDHGENFGEGGRLGHAFSLDERLIHVPLVFSYRPRSEPGTVFPLTELAGSIAHEVGLTDHPYEPPRPREIAVSRVEGVGTPDDPRVIAFLERTNLQDRVDQMTRDLLCTTDGRLKVQGSGNEWSLFDLAADPEEVRPLPLSAAPVEQVGRVMQLKTAAQAQLRMVVPATRPANASGRRSLEHDDEEMQRQMRLLGYL